MNNDAYSFLVFQYILYPMYPLIFHNVLCLYKKAMSANNFNFGHYIELVNINRNSLLVCIIYICGFPFYQKSIRTSSITS